MVAITAYMYTTAVIQLSKVVHAHQICLLCCQEYMTHDMRSMSDEIDLPRNER